ncbi:hypothetical protein GOEFS_093_00140 [Gordonia effusa NBRC 100432]|uniref:THIF-type NAD/FAD binding fold domain-containing protein n=1 Tax=Gordonia effusa NBRC 100432 TaxID=1077974 RepID=H0R3N4_9ACTN|nr:ThiF family adenylyltransferase [Gordonia effusa]GAB19685.1 hypothetical protein GOEFS_093_00140 [Gordonia effusa NBRC 100432]
MIDIISPEYAERIDELRCAGYAFVDGWLTAGPELAALSQLASGPDPIAEKDFDALSRYIVYPWRRTVVRLPDERVWHLLRTSRNRYLITDDEQAEWGRAVVAIAGLSVGASALHACALTGARHFHIADPDALGPTNLNRLAGSVCDLGAPKRVIAQRRLLEADPYTQVTAFGGYSPENAAEFFGFGDTRARVIVEEMDDLAMKVDLRRRARDAGIPVIMVTDVGDDVIADVERYDLDPTYPLFHGRAPDIADLTVEQLRDPKHRVAIAGAIVGDDIGPRLRTALTEVGRSIVTWPQLGSAATLAGAVASVLARKIVCGDDIPSGRGHLRVDQMSLSAK